MPAPKKIVSIESHPQGQGQTGKPAAGSRLSALIFGQPERGGTLSVDEIVHRLGMTKQQFGAMIGLSAETLQKTARAEAPKTQGRIREAIEILCRVEDWAGGPAQAAAWYKAQPIPAFGGRTAESLVKAGFAPGLREYLDHLAMGGFA